MAINLPDSATSVPKQKITKREKEVYYPESDGKPMAETEVHARQQIYLVTALDNFYAADPDVYTFGNNFIYFEEGNRKAVVSPDCYVTFGIPKRIRDIYKVWEEGGKAPDVIFEITSKSTRAEDVEKKWPLYEQRLKVAEYFLFDPFGDYLKPRLQGYRLVAGRYEPLILIDNRLHSEQMNLELVLEGDFLRLYDPVRGQNLLSPSELAEETVQLSLQVQQLRLHNQQTLRQLSQEISTVRERGDALQAELERLRVEMDTLRRQEPS